MTKTFFLLAPLLLMLACNNDDKKTTASGGKKEKEISPQVQALQQRVQQYPDSSGLRMKLAMELDSLNMFKPALAQMDSLIKKDSSNYGFWFTRGQVNEHAGDTSDAMKDYATAINIYASPDALLSLANLYAEQKNARSLLLCNQVKNMGLGRDYDASSAFVAGIYNSRIGQKDLAVKLFDECISNDYTYMPAYIEKGLVYFDAKQYGQALDVFSFAANVNHLYPDAYYYMGRCYELMNKKDSAAFYFKQSLALDKESSETEAALKRVE
jgi:tetratricopeptide (TPR) repeat protein